MTNTAVSAPAPEPNDDKRLAPFKQFVEALAPYPTTQYHHLIPTAFQESSDLWRPAASIVRVNPDDVRDVYPTPGGGGGFCLHSSALERIGNAMGIDWNRTEYEHDHVAEPFICTAHVSGWVTDSLGQRRRISASAKSDLREGTITANVLKGGINTARQFICERTESRARNRGIRKIGNIASSYSKQELAKPFVAIRFRLDERDPQVRAAMIAEGTRAADRVYGRELPEGPAMDAGTARPEDEATTETIQGQFTETPAAREPDVVEPEQEKPAESVDRVAEIRARVEKLRVELKGPDGKPWGDQARKKPASDPQVGLVAGSIGAAFSKVLDDPKKKQLRRAVLAALWGDFSDYAELTSDRMSATIDWAKSNGAEVRELVGLLMERDASLSSVRDALGQQGTLL